ncbi:MAG: HK97 gp10 family phage protein [Magnetococcales bacterium]|nr:HK97 gp10 family phage protein [Magnetococcales bacterium]
MGDVKITGMDEVVSTLKKFAPRVQANGLRAAVYAGSKVIADEAKRMAHVKTGTLKRAIIVTRDRKISTGPVQGMKITVRQGKKYRKVSEKTGKNLSQDAYYAKWVEFGTKASPGRKPRKKKSGIWTKGKRAKRGGNAAYPFMSPAFERKKMAAIDAVKERLKKAVEDASNQG